MSKTQTQNDANTTPAGDESSRQLRIVKWFNNKAGFGFVTTLEDSGKDIFVHHTGVSVDREQYKYLVQGEYVEFELRASDNEEHPYQAGGVRGVKGGMLMCETRMAMRRDNNKDGEWDGGRKPRQQSGGRSRGPRRGGRGPRDGDYSRDNRNGRGQNWNVSNEEQ